MTSKKTEHVPGGENKGNLSQEIKKLELVVKKREKRITNIEQTMIRLGYFDNLQTATEPLTIQETPEEINLPLTIDTKEVEKETSDPIDLNSQHDVKGVVTGSSDTINSSGAIIPEKLEPEPVIPIVETKPDIIQKENTKESDISPLLSMSKSEENVEQGEKLTNEFSSDKIADEIITSLIASGALKKIEESDLDLFKKRINGNIDFVLQNIEFDLDRKNKPEGYGPDKLSVSEYLKKYFIKLRLQKNIDNGQLDEDLLKLFLTELDGGRKDIDSIDTSRAKNPISYTDVIGLRRVERSVQLTRESIVDYQESLDTLMADTDNNLCFNKDKTWVFHYSSNSTRRGGEGRGHVYDRLYFSSNNLGDNKNIIKLWTDTIKENPDFDILEYKFSPTLKNREETLVLYVDDKVPSEVVSAAIKSFKKKCPPEYLSGTPMESAVEVSKGLDYAPEPKTLNDYVKFLGYDISSYNSIIARLLSLAVVHASIKNPNPANKLGVNKEDVLRNFRQLLKISFINPRTMAEEIGNHGKLPEWVEQIKD